MLRSTVEKVSAPSDKDISWLNHTPHAAAVYASWPSLPPAHATLTSRWLATPYLGWTFTSRSRQPPGAFLKYSDFGADMYGLALVTRKKFADENPETTRAVVKALNQGTKDTIAAPQKALDLLKARDPMMKVDIEKIRLDLALGLTNTAHVASAGLSSVTPEKPRNTIDAVVAAYGLPSTPSPASVYTDQYLPPASERMVPKGG